MNKTTQFQARIKPEEPPAEEHTASTICFSKSSKIMHSPPTSRKKVSKSTNYETSSKPPAKPRNKGRQSRVLQEDEVLAELQDILDVEELGSESDDSEAILREIPEDQGHTRLELLSDSDLRSDVKLLSFTSCDDLNSLNLKLDAPSLAFDVADHSVLIDSDNTLERDVSSCDEPSLAEPAPLLKDVTSSKSWKGSRNSSIRLKPIRTNISSPTIAFMGTKGKKQKRGHGK